MLWILLFLAVVALLALPHFILKRIDKCYNVERDDIKGDGFSFAEHLLKRFELDEIVKVEAVELGDHYDPDAKAVRLSKAFCHKRSITAIATAAHEVSHAIQHAENNTLFRRRQLLAKVAGVIGLIAPVALAVAPVLLFFTKSPSLSFTVLALGFLSVFMQTLFHLVTLPVELDASFNKALPMLIEGDYLPRPEDYEGAKKVLSAAAFTYVAGSLLNLLNIGAWLRLLKR